MSRKGIPSPFTRPRRGFNMRLPRLAQRIHWKLMLPYALLTVFFAVLGTYLVTRLVTGSLEERFTNQLAESSRVASDAVVRRERTHLEMVRGVAYTVGVPEALAAHDAATLQGLVEPLAANAKTERVEVLDRNGARVLGLGLNDPATLTYTPLTEADDRASWSLVADVLSGRSDGTGDKWAQLAWTGQGPALYTAGPIRDLDGNVAGVVLVGSLLQSFLPAVKLEALADVTFYDAAGTPLASTFYFGAEEQASLAVAREAGMAGGILRERKSLFGRDYELVYGDLRLRNEVVGQYSVALPSKYISSAGSSAQLRMSVLFAAITAAVLGLGWLIARRLTGPLLRLVGAARAFSDGDLSARSGLRRGDEIGELAESFDRMAERLQRQHLATVGALASAIDARDPYTAGHSIRVGHLSSDIGRTLGLGRAELQHLLVGGYLHDIGKIGVRDSVLLKSGQLTPQEREIIEQHPRIGLEILAPAELPEAVLAIVGGHHERLNGTGYPLALRDDELSAFPRIAAVADIYDALTTDRPYRKAMEVGEALHLLRREADAGLLDPGVVSAMRHLAREWEDRRRSDPVLLGHWIDLGIREAA
ncbi:MAG: HD domain-containing protein [Dehalococcoidia bacterium]|nr:HD domain-containing protein [Dehalococcoidia bacterium]